MKFAKLFDLEDGEQVLLTVEYDDEDDEYKLSIKSDFDGATATMKLGYKEEHLALEAMGDYDLDKAKKFRATFEKQFVKLND